jgi:tripartite-type tricarboxylate transporter receptor subunit TctC
MEDKMIAGLVRSMKLAVAALCLTAGAVQAFPDKTIHIITTETGGSNDLIARILAQELSTRLGQSVVVENRPSGVVPNQEVARAEPDGHTLLLTGSSMWMGALFREVPYDPVKDFTPVALVAQDANVLVVHPSLPVNTVAELIDYAKARPGELNYAATSIGGSMHLAAELFKSLAGVDIVRIGYSGGNQARTDLMAGNVQLAVIGADNAVPMAQSGKVRPLGVSTLVASTLVPGVPAIAETLPGFEIVGFTAILAPPGTPENVVTKLNAEINAILEDPKVNATLIGFNQERVGGPPSVLAAKIADDTKKWSALIESAGLKDQ